MALTADVLVNDALVVSPGPPAWLAVNASKTGESEKEPPVSLSVPGSCRPISSGVVRLIDSVEVSVSVNVSSLGPDPTVHDRMTSAPSGRPPGGTGVVSP